MRALPADWRSTQRTVKMPYSTARAAAPSDRYSVVVGFIPLSPSQFLRLERAPKRGHETLTQPQPNEARRLRKGRRRQAKRVCSLFLLVLLRRPPAKRALL